MMIPHNNQLQKLKFILFPPTRFPCNSIAIHPDVKCSTRENHNQLNHEIKSSNRRYRPHTGSTSDCQEDFFKVKETQLRPSLSSSVTTKVNQEQNNYVQSQITTCSTVLARQDNCPTWIHSSNSYYNDDDTRAMTPLSEQDVAFDRSTLSDKIHQKPMYDHPNHHDTREIASSIRRCMLPFQVRYELEWPMPNHHTSSALTKKTWLQLDNQTSSGIERVRKLGFADLDVRINDQLTRYISSLTGSRDDSIVIKVLFDPSMHNDNNHEDTSINSNQVRLLRLRRVHWWSISYNLARTCLPVH